MTTQPQKPARRAAIRSVLRQLINIAFAVVCDFRITGKENVPMDAPLIVVGNHFSFIDAVAAIHAVPRSLEFVGGTQMPSAPVIVRFIPALWGVHRVHRGSSSRDALKAAEEVLADGGTLGIFPEASALAGVLRPARPGAALLAVRSGAPILPLGLDGLTEVFPSLRRGKHARVDIRIGKPFGPFEGSARGRADRQQLDEIGHTIMRKIAELIPPERRGHYSDDPAIREAAKGTEIYIWDSKPER